MKAPFAYFGGKTTMASRIGSPTDQPDDAHNRQV